MHEPGLPLDHFRTAHRCEGVLFTCGACMNHWRVAVDVVIADLQARGVGNGRTGVREVASLARKPCARCGGRQLTTAPAWR